MIATSRNEQSCVPFLEHEMKNIFFINHPYDDFLAKRMVSCKEDSLVHLFVNNLDLFNT